MDSVAQIYTPKGKSTVYLSDLQVAEIASASAGFFDIDLKDNDPGNYTIIAYGKNKSIQSKGKTIKQAVESLLEKLGF